MELTHQQSPRWSTGAAETEIPCALAAEKCCCPDAARLSGLREEITEKASESDSHGKTTLWRRRGFPEHLEKDASQAGLEVPP